MGKKNKPVKRAGDGQIAKNKRATFDYQISEKFEAGMVLQGWEVKSLRAGKVQLTDAFVQLRNGEAWLYGCGITPLISASTHHTTVSQRPKKLLLHRRELSRLIGSVERKGFTIVGMRLYWNRGRVKVEIGLAKGKKEFDKRATIKERDWQRDKARMLRPR